METQSTGEGPAKGAARPDHDELAPGEKVGAYRIVRLIGRGGMGEVYEAVDTRLGRQVALKRIAAHRREDGAARARFWREARGLAAVRHEGLVAVYEIGEDPKSGLFIAMELVVGVPLTHLVAEGGRLEPALAVDLVAQASEALGAAHAAGLVHRDVKPGNLLVERGGRVRVVDFGLARRVDDLEQLTRDGAVLGTPAFMAPEQVEGKEVGPPADVFALGLVLYRLLSGVHPFSRESAEATALAIAGSLRRPLEDHCPDLDPRLVAVVDKALAVHAAERFADAGALGLGLCGLGMGPPSGALRAQLDRTGWQVPAALSPSAVASDRGSRSPRWVGFATLGKSRRRWPFIAAGLGLVVIAALWFFRHEPVEAQTADGTRIAEGAANPIISKSKISADVAAAAPGAMVVTGDGVPAPRDVLSEALPERPVVLVLGFEADERGRSDAEVMAEVLRVRLSEHEGKLDSVPLDVARALGVGEPSPDLSPTLLGRASRRFGPVDLLVRGRVLRLSDKVRVEVELVETGAARVLASWSHDTPDKADAPIELAERMSAELDHRLGLVAPTRARLSRVPAAWTALIQAKRAGRGADLGGARTHLEWSLRADPDFALAKVEELAVLRMEVRHDELAEKAGEVLSQPERLTPSARGFAQALWLWANQRSDEALRELDQLLVRFPYEVDPALQLMALRAKDPLMRDPAEVERIARKVLAIAPRQETSASRLVRALGIQGRVAEAEGFFGEIGLLRTDEELAQLWAEVDLFAGRHDQAARGFAAVLEKEPGNVYYEHLAISAELLAGRCTEAAGMALDRITRLESVRRESMLDWTYSLAAQATICAEAFEGLDGLLAGWSRHSESGRSQAASLRERIEVVRAKLAGDGAAIGKLEAHWRAEILRAGPGDTAQGGAVLESGAELTRVGAYLRVGADKAVLEVMARLAKRRSLDRAVPAPDRWAWRTIGLGVAARQALAEGRPAEEVIALFDQAIPEKARIAGEDESRWYVEALVWRAEALDALGDERASGAWADVAALGIHRLWFNELWLLARHRASSK